MKFQKSLIGATLALLALQANASAPTFSSVAGSIGDYAAPIFTTPNSTLAYVANDTVPNVRLLPMGDSNTYLIVTTGGSATINLGGARSFSFLWGSPDLTNLINIDGYSFTGSSLLGGLANSSNANTRWATFTSDVGMTNFTISTGQVAFEMAVTNPVPEPETYALMLGGLGALAFVVRRRKI